MEERNGHVSWKRWSFDYNVADTEGLTLLNGFFRGRRVFHKLSLPVIRVKYLQDQDFSHNPLLGNGCGPYNDQISWDPVDFGEDLNPIAGPHHLVEISDCFSHYICIRSTENGGRTWLELGVYARIGAYHIYQAWYLNDDGTILPRVFSKGLSCNVDHWHHPYWRFDFDLDGASGQRVNVFNGSTWFGFVNLEGRLQNQWFGDARYNVENLQTGLKAWIIPPALDEEKGIVGPTAFSNLDADVRLYRPEEDRAWPHAADHEIGFNVHENPDGGDVVFWSMAHLFHHAAEGKDHWHSVGPTIFFELPPAAPVGPGDCRHARFQGHIHIKDFKLIGHDKWGHFDFDESLTLDPNGPHGELQIQRGPTGDVTATLIFKVDLRADQSLAVSFTAELYDEGERVASASSEFNVLRDSSIDWSGLHLVDHHGGDPDTSDMDFTVKNEPCPAWQRFGLASSESASSGSALAAVSRIPESMELWWIGGDGSVRGAYWYAGNAWKRYELAPARSAATAAGLAAVSRLPGSMEVWWVAPNGSVQAAYWYEDVPWKSYQLAPPGAASGSGGVAGVSRLPNTMEVWWIGANGSVQGAYWYEGATWKRYELAPAGSAAGSARIAAVSRLSKTLELWWIGANGSVQAAYWYEGGAWKRYEVAPAGTASTTGGIDAVSRISSSLELWWIGASGSVQGAYWYEGGAWTRYEVAPPGSASTTAGLSAVSRIPQSMELWWVAPNGSIQAAFWYENSTWQRYELAPATTAALGSGVQARSRIPNSMEVWWVGNDGSVLDAFWYA